MQIDTFFHVYLVNNWKEISTHILANVPHDKIVIHASYDLCRPFSIYSAIKYFRKYQNVDEIFLSRNDHLAPEVKGFKKMLSQVNLDEFNTLTYMHGKGVTKHRNKNIRDWVELMRYFNSDRIDLIHEAFGKGFVLYGVNLATHKEGEERYGPFEFSDYHYSGNFVTLNLDRLKDKLYSTSVDEGYFGLEGYWGKLVDVSGAFCAHTSCKHINNHYNEGYPSSFYR